MKIIIGLIEHFGDIVACEPVARYLRHKYPDAHLSWAVQRAYRDLIDSNPNINEPVIVECLTDWIKLYRHGHYDLVVDLHVNYRVCEHCRVPLIKEHGNPFVNAYEWFDYGAILEAFSQGAGLPKLSAQPRVYINDEVRSSVDILNLPARYVVIHRESNSAVKHWPNESWDVVIRFLQEQLGLSVIEVGSKKPSHTVASTALQEFWIDLTDKTSLLQTAEVIRRSHFYVGIDSGPAHLANAVMTPGIVLLGRLLYFRQYNPFTGFYSRTSSHVRIVRNLTGVVAEISIDEVIEAVKYLVGALKERDAPTDVPAPSPPGHTYVAFRNGDYAGMVSQSGLFDPSWYVTHYPEVLASGLEPLQYFIAVGGLNEHSPGPNFNAAWYKSQRGDLSIVTDSLHHYLHHGRQEGLQPCCQSTSAVLEMPPTIEHLAATVRDLYCPSEQERAPDVSQAPGIPHVFAFYLPQFHPISENDHGHRPGFTEWDNVLAAKPLFRGHYQPRIPGELGYYDLRSADVMREQVRLANSHGITGFCFYFYYFQGKKLLYKPIDNYIRSDIQAPFFFLWANENWTRRWDGGDNEVIISQNHSPEDDLLFIRELLPTFADKRYFKVEGKSILAVYKTHLFPDIRRTTELWRREIVRRGFPGIYLVMVDDWQSDSIHPRELGFDAAYEIPSNIIPNEVLVSDLRHLRIKEGFTGRIVDYKKFASFHMGRPFPEYKRFRTVMAPWDNTPRYGLRAIVHTNTDNDAYQLWLEQALIDTSRRYTGDEQLVFLHSWNEWCEGTYVEPDGRYGRRLLHETKEVVDRVRRISTNADTDTARQLYRLMGERDEGCARSLQAMRQQNMYLHREMQRKAADLHRETEGKEAAEHLLNSIYQSKSWRFTKPLRDIMRLLGRK